MLDYKGLFDLDIKQEKCSFKDEDFAYTTRYDGEIELRKVELYSNTDVRVLKFGYSRNGSGGIFIRFRNHRNYDPNVYYEVKDSGMSSGGGRESTRIHNPWEAIIPGWKLYTQQDWGFLTETGNNFNFLSKIHDQEAIDNELLVEYIRLPIEVREIAYLCEDIKTGSILCCDYSSYRNDYTNYRFRMIHQVNVVEELEITKFDRYRDGGTTEMTLVDGNGIEHEFYYPTHFKPIEEQLPTLDGKPLTLGVSDTVKESVINLLGIILDPRKKD